MCREPLDTETRNKQRIAQHGKNWMEERISKSLNMETRQP